MSDIYEPAEDSFLIIKHIPKDLDGKKVLDIGCGSGILSKKAKDSGGIVLGIDINEDALENTSKLGIEIRRSDLFENISDKYDLILFNAPYVPSDKDDKYLSKGLKKATVSGEKGSDLIKRFLLEFKKYLSSNGKVLMIISSHNEIKEELESHGWKKIDSCSFFFEKIYLMEFKNQDAKELQQ